MRHVQRDHVFSMGVMVWCETLAGYASTKKQPPEPSSKSRSDPWANLSVKTAKQTPIDHLSSAQTMRDVLQEQLSRLGDTPYFLERLESEITGAPLAPLSRLNALRRSAVAKLNQMRASIGKNRGVTAVSVAEIRREKSPTPAALDHGLSLLCRTLAQVEAGLECGMTLEGFQDIKVGDILEFVQTELVKRTLGG